MSLKIENINGRSCPIVECDVCAQKIESASEGNYQFQMWDEEGKTIPITNIYFIHKRCAKLFDELHGKNRWGFMSLDCLPIYLGNNLGIDWDSATSRADTFGQL